MSDPETERNPDIPPYETGLETPVPHTAPPPDKPAYDPGEPPEDLRVRSALIVAAAFTASALAYKFLFHEGLGHTSLMFIGIPGILAVLLALAPRAKSVTGGLMKGITLALLMLAPLLGEGFLCILFAAPLFYLVGLIVGLLLDWDKRRSGSTVGCIALVLVPLSLEGVVPALTPARQETVAATALVEATPDAVRSALAQPLRIDERLPRALSIGFPRPLAASGAGLAIGDLRVIHFSGAEGHPPGDLTLRVASVSVNHVHFDVVSDTSKLQQWIAWRAADIAFAPASAGDTTHTLVTWKLSFDRQLDPSWYFRPVERAAAGEAARFLIRANVEANLGARDHAPALPRSAGAAR